MAINKVVLDNGTSDGEVLIDLTNDTVTANDLVSGKTAHDRSGTVITGTLDIDSIKKGLVYYGTCSTAAETQAKTVSIDGIEELYIGLHVRICFVNGQTYNGAPTLNVNNLGAKTIMRVSGVSSEKYEWIAGEVLDLVYNGTYFILIDGGLATTEYYGVTKLVSSCVSTSDAVALTPSALNYVARNMISGLEAYSKNETYSVGDRVRAGTGMYECNTEITTPEEWTSSHWTLISPLLTQIDTLKNSGIIDRGYVSITNIDQIKNLIPGAYRIYNASTNIFPHANGVLVITKAGIYNTALFYPVNVSKAAAVYRRTWNSNDNAWYENEWKRDLNPSDLPLSISNGGTGATSASDARTNLGLGTVAVENTVPVNKGGTGATSASDARTNLGLGTVAVENTVPVNKGGTGATSLSKFAIDHATTIPAPSSDTDILNLDTGFYRVGLSETSAYLPARYGVLEIIHASSYGIARFSSINSSVGKLWQRMFNVNDKVWYDSSWTKIL